MLPALPGETDDLWVLGSGLSALSQDALRWSVRGAEVADWVAAGGYATLTSTLPQQAALYDDGEEVDRFFVEPLWTVPFGSATAISTAVACSACVANAFCLATGATNGTCTCKPGFSGPQCEDIDECPDACGPNALCTNLVGSFTCARLRWPCSGMRLVSGSEGWPHLISEYAPRATAGTRPAGSSERTMSAKSHRPHQGTETAAHSQGASATDFGSNAAAQEDMMASGDQTGPVRYRIKDSKGDAGENTWAFGTIGPGTNVNVQEGTKVTCGGLSGRVTTARPTSALFVLYNETDPGSLSGEVATFHRGTSYSYGQWHKGYEKRKEEQKKRVDRSDDDNKREREDEYKTRR